MILAPHKRRAWRNYGANRSGLFTAPAAQVGRFVSFCLCLFFVFCFWADASKPRCAVQQSITRQRCNHKAARMRPTYRRADKNWPPQASQSYMPMFGSLPCSLTKSCMYPPNHCLPLLCAVHSAPNSAQSSACTSVPDCSTPPHPICV